MTTCCVIIDPSLGAAVPRRHPLYFEETGHRGRLLRTRRIRRKLRIAENERYAIDGFFIQILLFQSTKSSTLMAKKDSAKQNDLALRREASLITPTDLGSKASKNIAGGMNGILADVFALYLKTKNFHWHMSGPHFRDYHLLLDEQADQLYAMTDPIAERIRKTGGSTLRSIGHIARIQRIKDNDAVYVDPQDMLAELREDNITLAARLREVHDMVDEMRDIATASLIENWIDETERRTWFLFESSRRGDKTGH
jgi:starvation-inducible DNA-binding protein